MKERMGQLGKLIGRGGIYDALGKLESFRGYNFICAAILIISIFLCPIIATAANIEAKLDTTDGTSGLVVQDSGSAEVLRVNSDGNVGIGFTNPTTSLYIRTGTASTNPTATLETNDGNIQMFIYVGNPEGALSGAIGDLSVDPTNGKMYIKNTQASATSLWVELVGSGSSGSSKWTDGGSLTYLTSLSICTRSSSDCA